MCEVVTLQVEKDPQGLASALDLVGDGHVCQKTHKTEAKHGLIL